MKMNGSSLHNVFDIIPPEIILEGYKEGYFPMAESNNGKIYWYFADPRAIIPLDTVKIHKSVRQTIRREQLHFKVDSNFKDVVRKCAQRDETWISEEIIKSYINLYDMGYAHSVETYKDDKLVGGLYGVALGGVFFGESMFNEMSNASKAAFFYLVYHLNQKGFILLDSQFINEHTKLLGAIEIPAKEYLQILKKAIKLPVTFL